MRVSTVACFATLCSGCVPFSGPMTRSAFVPLPTAVTVATPAEFSPTVRTSVLTGGSTKFSDGSAFWLPRAQAEFAAGIRLNATTSGVVSAHASMSDGAVPSVPVPPRPKDRLLLGVSLGAQREFSNDGPVSLLLDGAFSVTMVPNAIALSRTARLEESLLLPSASVTALMLLRFAHVLLAPGARVTTFPTNSGSDELVRSALNGFGSVRLWLGGGVEVSTSRGLWLGAQCWVAVPDAGTRLPPVLSVSLRMETVVPRGGLSQGDALPQ